MRSPVTLNARLWGGLVAAKRRKGRPSPAGATTADCYVIGRCASRTEYTPKIYSLASTTDATTASRNAANGENVTAKAMNKTPKAPKRRCKLAEPAKVGFAIGSTPSTMLQPHDESGMELSRLCCLFKFKVQSTLAAATRLAGCQNLEFPSSDHSLHNAKRNGASLRASGTRSVRIAAYCYAFAHLNRAIPPTSVVNPCFS